MKRLVPTMHETLFYIQGVNFCVQGLGSHTRKGFNIDIFICLEYREVEIIKMVSVLFNKTLKYS